MLLGKIYRETYPAGAEVAGAVEPNPKDGVAAGAAVVFGVAAAVPNPPRVGAAAAAGVAAAAPRPKPNGAADVAAGVAEAPKRDDVVVVAAVGVKTLVTMSIMVTFFIVLKQFHTAFRKSRSFR